MDDVDRAWYGWGDLLGDVAKVGAGATLGAGLYGLASGASNLADWVMEPFPYQYGGRKTVEELKQFENINPRSDK
jgi:hypothetical protein